MTLHETIAQLDALKYNTYTQAEKLHWLSNLEGRIRREILDTHVGGPEGSFIPFTQDTPMDTVLSIGEPWHEIYLRYLEMQVDYANGEIEKFNNSSAIFQAVYDAFARHYNRTHMPKAKTGSLPEQYS